jgi:hypothetical protein
MNTGFLRWEEVADGNVRFLHVALPIGSLGGLLRVRCVF